MEEGSFARPKTGRTLENLKTPETPPIYHDYIQQHQHMNVLDQADIFRLLVASVSVLRNQSSYSWSLVRGAGAHPAACAAAPLSAGAGRSDSPPLRHGSRDVEDERHTRARCTRHRHASARPLCGTVDSVTSIVTVQRDWMAFCSVCTYTCLHSCLLDWITRAGYMLQQSGSDRAATISRELTSTHAHEHDTHEAHAFCASPCVVVLACLSDVAALQSRVSR